MLDSAKPYVIYCNTGRRSEAAASFLNAEGYQVSLLSGGLLNYSEEDQQLFEVAE